MTAIVTSIVVIAVVLVGVIAFVALSLSSRRRDSGNAGLEDAESIVREAIATTAAPRAKARIVRHAA